MNVGLYRTRMNSIHPQDEILVNYRCARDIIEEPNAHRFTWTWVTPLKLSGKDERDSTHMIKRVERQYHPSYDDITLNYPHDKEYK